MTSVFVFAGIAYKMIQHEAYGWATGLLGAELVALTSVFIIGRRDKPNPKQTKMRQPGLSAGFSLPHDRPHI